MESINIRRDCALRQPQERHIKKAHIPSGVEGRNRYVLILLFDGTSQQKGRRKTTMDRLTNQHLQDRLLHYITFIDNVVKLSSVFSFLLKKKTLSNQSVKN